MRKFLIPARPVFGLKGNGMVGRMAARPYPKKGYERAPKAMTLPLICRAPPGDQVVGAKDLSPLRFAFSWNSDAPKP